MPEDRLSEREHEIAQAYADGDNYRQIAQALFISPATVRTHIATIYRKLHVSSKLELHRLLSGTARQTISNEGVRQTASVSEPVINSAEVRSSINNPVDRQISVQEWHPSIVVLPFKNISGNPHQNSFVDGLTEDVISSLSRIHGLLVIARNSAFFYKDVPTSIETIAQELKVRYVLEGSARMSSTRVRVTAHLIDATTSRQVWTETYDKDLTDVFDVQDEITRAVTSSTQTQVVLNEGEQRRAQGDADFQDLRDIAKLGWRYIYDLKRESFVQALALATKALRINAEHPSGHQLRAAALYHRAFLGYSEDRVRDLSEAREAIRTAINLDDRDEYSHWIMGLTAFYSERDVTLATNELTRAIELNPNFSLAYAASGTVYSYAGSFDKAIANSELALRLNPRDPSNFFRYSAMAVAHFTVGNFEESRTLAEQSLRSGPSWRVAHIIRIASLVSLEELVNAKRAVANFLVHWPAETVSTASALPFIDQEHNRVIANCARKVGLRGQSLTAT